MRFGRHRYGTALAVATIFPLAFPLPARAQEGERVRAESPLAAVPATPRLDVPATDMVELHRLRIVNKHDGAIQVSTDGGKTWQLIGRVLIPAVTVLEGYLACQYAQPGTVAATAVHGLRIRTSGEDPNLRAPFVLAIEPKEYAAAAPEVGKGKPNKGFGGYVAGSSGIYTDIPAGTAIFRDLAPFTGNPVFLESNSGRQFPLPAAFRPAGQGETLVIIVQAPRNSMVSLTLENKAGGQVEATFADGKTLQITGVIQPVQGVGRFDGTAYTGVGRINTAHTGVITVSTALVDGSLREGEGKERRGGFQIEPAWHNARTEEAGAPMVMTLGSPGPRHRELEGMPPLFRDTIRTDDAGETVAEVSIDEGPWEPMPAIVGARPYAFTAPGLNAVFKEQGINRRVTQGITGFRLHFPPQEPKRSLVATTTAVEAYRVQRLADARAGKVPIVNGVLTVNANPTNSDRVAYVRLCVEGSPRGFTNVAPFTLSWDTTRVSDGEYLIEADAMDETGTILATTRRRVYVLNNPDRVSAASAATSKAAAR